MPALVARDLLEWITARGGQLAAGAAPPGLDRGVAGIARPRRMISRDLEAINTHDVVLVSYDAFSPSAEFSLEALIATLAETQAALVIAGLPPDQLTARARSLADQVCLPLIALPRESDLAEVVRDIGEFVQQREVAAARFVREAVTALSRGRRSEDPLDSQTQALADFTRLYFILEDDHRVVVMTATPHEPPCTLEQVTAALASPAARQMVRPATPAALGDDIPIQRHLPGKLARAVVPLRSGATTIAYLSLLGPVDLITPVHVDVLWRVAPAFAFEIGKLRKQGTDWRRTAAEDLEGMLRGAILESEAARRASHYGLDLAGALTVALALPPEGAASQWGADLLERLQSLVPLPWVAPWDDGVVALFQDSNHAAPALQRFIESTLESPHHGVVGLGRPQHGLVGLRTSLIEAQQAARVRQLAGPGIAAFQDLGVMRLLYPLQENGALDRFCRETLEPLLNADSYHGDSLLETLEAWFIANANLTEAARRLTIHRNTLMYRLRRIEETLGATLENADLRLELQLALKIWRMRQP